MWDGQVPGSVPVSDAGTRTALGLGIVGCGGAAADVARAVASVPGLCVTGLHDQDITLAEDLARSTGGLVHASLGTLLASDEVEAVYVAVPHDLLAPIGRAVLEAGRHALLEKPMALDLATLDALDALARRQDRTLGVFYEMRFAPVARAAAHLVHEGAIGTVRAIRIRTLIDKSPDYWRVGLSGRSASPWRGQRARAGGGVVLMNSSHQLELVAAITGLAVTRVAGTVMTTVPDIDVEDTAAAVLWYGGGAVGSLVAGAHVPGATDAETIEIDGELGGLELEPYAGRLRVHLRRPWADIPAGRWIEPSVEPADPFVTALAAFATAVRTRSRAPVGAPEARAVLATVLGLYQSAVSGAVVEIGAALSDRGAAALPG
jgi:predicted dehydrogenase